MSLSVIRTWWGSWVQGQCHWPFPKRQILESSKLKEFADDNLFQSWWKWQKVFQIDRKHGGKRRNCSLRAISPFPTVFFKRLVLHTRKNQGLFGKGLRPSYRRGHQTSPTVVSLKGRLSQKLQSKSILSSETVEIHSLISSWFYKETEIKI